jgi:hypothetical protein
MLPPLKIMRPNTSHPDTVKSSSILHDDCKKHHAHFSQRRDDHCRMPACSTARPGNTHTHTYTHPLCVDAWMVSSRNIRSVRAMTAGSALFSTLTRKQCTHRAAVPLRQ